MDALAAAAGAAAAEAEAHPPPQEEAVPLLDRKDLLVEGKRTRKLVARAGFVALKDDAVYEDVEDDELDGRDDYGDDSGGGAADDSDSDGGPRRTTAATLAALRAKRAKKETLLTAMESDVARGVGFDPYSISEEELAYLSAEVVDEGAYCECRNHVLAKWRADVSRPLSEESARTRIAEKHRKLATESYRFLHRHGYINFGVVARPPPAGPSSTKGTILILGAGLAGLAAARQLMAFGHKVAVVEARHRSGGRVHTTRLWGAPPADGSENTVYGVGEQGGSVITGADGNPLAVVARQLGAQLHTIRDRCPIYALDGSPVPEDMDKKVEKQFNTLLDACGAFRMDIGGAADVVSLGRAMEQLSSEHGVGTASAAERRLLDWHMANLEYANAGFLAQLSLGQWDQDDPWEMTGDHCLLPGGNLRIVGAMAEGVPIFYGCEVARVEHGPGGVALHCTQQPSPGGDENNGDGNGGAPREKVFRADAALITLPLGVLKAGAVEFVPQLPTRKRQAIEALGFGTLNKCVMLFEAPFWDTSLDTFGQVAPTTVARGEFFLFYSYVGLSGPGAVLIGLVAGEAATAFEEEDAEAGLERCLATLRRIFAPRGVDVPAPASWRCTRWAADPFARGSYSHVAVGASGEDYDAMMEPVGGRLFFAGEATTKKHPATMHGAFFTGLREAARITATVAGRKGAKRGGGGGGGGAGADGGGLDSQAASAAALEAARDAAHLAKQLAAAFAAPTWEFGCFALALNPTATTSADAPALVRVDVGGGTGAASSKRTLPVYLCLRLVDALALRDCAGGDAERLTLLLSLPGGALFARRALPPAACELAAELAAAQGVPRVRPQVPDEAAEEEEAAPPEADTHMADAPAAEAAAPLFDDDAACVF